MRENIRNNFENQEYKKPEELKPAIKKLGDAIFAVSVQIEGNIM